MTTGSLKFEEVQEVLLFLFSEKLGNYELGVRILLSFLILLEKKDAVF